MTKTVTVNQEINVIVDESKFTPEFMENFNKHFHQKDTIEGHMIYIAEMYARGVILSDRDFLEGYGNLNEFGVKLTEKSIDADIW